MFLSNRTAHNSIDLSQVSIPVRPASVTSQGHVITHPGNVASIPVTSQGHVISHSGANVIKPFYVYNKLEYFAPGKPFWPDLYLWIRPGAYPKVKSLSCAPLLGRFGTLPNIRQGWKGLPGKNTPA